MFCGLVYTCKLLSHFCNILIPFPHLILKESSDVSLTLGRDVSEHISVEKNPICFILCFCLYTYVFNEYQLQTPGQKKKACE